MNHKIHIANLGELEKEEQQSIALRRALFSNNKAIDVENYHTYEEASFNFHNNFFVCHNINITIDYGLLG